MCICTGWNSTSRYELRLQLQRIRGWVESEEGCVERTNNVSQQLCGRLSTIRDNGAGRAPSHHDARIHHMESRNGSECDAAVQVHIEPVHLILSKYPPLFYTSPNARSSIIGSCLQVPLLASLRPFHLVYRRRCFVWVSPNLCLFIQGAARASSNQARNRGKLHQKAIFLRVAHVCGL